MSPDGRVYFASDIHRMMNEYNVGTSYLRAETAEVLLRDLDDHFQTDMQNITGWMGGDRLKKILIETSEGIDRYQRIQAFIDEIESGVHPREAAEKVRNTFYDYAHLTEFEKNILRTVFLFYSFARKNMDFMTTMLLKNPDRVMGFLRLRRDLSAEATGFLEPELATASWYAGRFILPGFNVSSNKQAQTSFNLQDQGEGLHTGTWVPVSPLTIDYDYFLLMQSLVGGIASGITSVFDKKSEYDLQREFILGEYGWGQVNPLLQLPSIILSGKKPFMSQNVESQIIDNGLLAIDSFMSRSVGSAYPRIFGVNGSPGFIKIKTKDAADRLADEFEDETRRSAASQLSYILSGKGSPVIDYNHFAPENEAEGIKYFLWNDIIGPGVIGPIPFLGLAIGKHTGRPGSHYKELNQNDLGTWMLGKKASEVAVDYFLAGQGKSLAQVIKESEQKYPNNREMKKAYFIRELTASDDKYLSQEIHAPKVKTPKITEYQAGIMYDVYIKPLDVPS